MASGSEHKNVMEKLDSFWGKHDGAMTCRIVEERTKEKEERTRGETSQASALLRSKGESQLPRPMRVVSIPYSIELNDSPFHHD